MIERNKSKLKFDIEKFGFVHNLCVYIIKNQFDLKKKNLTM